MAKECIMHILKVHTVGIMEKDIDNVKVNVHIKQCLKLIVWYTRNFNWLVGILLFWLNLNTSKAILSSKYNDTPTNTDPTNFDWSSGYCY